MLQRLTEPRATTKIAYFVRVSWSPPLTFIEGVHCRGSDSGNFSDLERVRRRIQTTDVLLKCVPLHWSFACAGSKETISIPSNSSEHVEEHRIGERTSYCTCFVCGDLCFEPFFMSKFAVFGAWRAWRIRSRKGCVCGHSMGRSSAARQAVLPAPPRLASLAETAKEIERIKQV